ncbi:MAG TPA: hypothetical protein VLE73_01900 [Candidatus Saccharimonadales bacterium]|nr:hypothetical protein [Candidatus Saccharimonadales bacterium]
MASILIGDVYMKLPDGRLEIAVMPAAKSDFLAPAILINRRSANPDTGLPVTPKAVEQFKAQASERGTEQAIELNRTRKGLYDMQGHRPIGALAILRGGEQDGLHLAYAYTTEQYLHVDEHPVCLRSACVDPAFRGKGLSAVVAVESLNTFSSARAYKDCVGAAGILLGHEFETIHPDVAAKRLDQYYVQTFMGIPLSMPPENAPSLPANPRVEEVIQTIQQAFPSTPDYTVVNRYP